MNFQLLDKFTAVSAWRPMIATWAGMPTAVSGVRSVSAAE